MSPRSERLLWILTIAAALVTLVRGGSAVGTFPSREVSWRSASTAALRATPEEHGAMALRVSAGDVFRLDRRPAGVPFRQQAELAAIASPPRPALVLVGLVGPPWRAVIDGLPGAEGSTILAVGEGTAGFRIRSIRSDTVFVTGADTLWRLTVRRAW